jgi:hypothetical protein
MWAGERNEGVREGACEKTYSHYQISRLRVEEQWTV